MITQEGGRRFSSFHQVNQNPDESGKRHLAKGRKKVKEEQKREGRPYWSHEMPKEGQENARRLSDGGGRKWINAILKPAEHGITPMDLPASSRKT